MKWLICTRIADRCCMADRFYRMEGPQKSRDQERDRDAFQGSALFDNPERRTEYHVPPQHVYSMAA